MAGGGTLSILGQHKSNMAVLHDLYNRLDPVSHQSRSSPQDMTQSGSCRPWWPGSEGVRRECLGRGRRKHMQGTSAHWWI